MVARGLAVLSVTAALLAGCGTATAPPPTDAAGAPPPEAPGCPLLPADSYWYARADELPLHPRSSDFVAAVGLDEPVHPDFGSGTFDGGPIGIPYTTVPGDQERVEVRFDFDDESDPGPYPIPPDPPVEGGPDSDGDRHVLVVDRDACVLYELFDAHPQPDGSWQAGSGAVFDLRSNALRPDTWTSADAAGLPILPGLVRFDEVAAGVVDHAIRITAPRTDRSYIWPARHQAGADDDPSLPPMGLRLRLRADVDVSAMPEQARVVATALQTHGAVLADNGSPWFITGVPDERWDNDALRALRELTGADWEAVDTSGLIVDPDSAQAAALGQTPEPEPGRTGGRVAGPTRIDTAIAIAQRQFPNGSGVVYLARADVVVDAVAGGVLTDGPILLVPQCGDLPPAVAQEIRRLDPGRVLTLGGEAAVCDAILAAAVAA